MDLIRWLWHTINLTEEGVKWWMFWHPGSGLRGAAIAAFVTFHVLLGMARLLGAN